jgi:hypothetical protein
VLTRGIVPISNEFAGGEDTGDQEGELVSAGDVAKSCGMLYTGRILGVQKGIGRARGCGEELCRILYERTQDM